jgi:esterase/lipase
MIADTSRIHFVLVAGFSSDHKESYGLKHVLLNLGYSAYAVSFYGKDYQDDFTHITKAECIQNLTDYINDCCAQYDEVYGIGISLGGALLLEHAKTHTNLKGIVSIGTPFKLKHRWLISIADFLLPVIYPLWRRLQKIKRLRITPIGAGKEMVGYMENEFLQNLDRIETPVLFLQSKKDSVTDWHTLETNITKIKSPIKEIEYFTNGSHVIDHDPALVTEMALKFLKKLS